MTVGERLRRLAQLHEERNQVYGKDYHHTGRALAAFYPDGLTLRTPEDFRRFMIRCFMLSKLMRDANQVAVIGRGHPDSLDDLSVYAQMAQELEDLEREGK